MGVKLTVQEILTNPKTSVAVSSTTMGSGLGYVTGWIPDDIAKLATLVGAVLSIVLIRYWWRKGRADLTKTRLEIEILRHQRDEAIRIAEDRRVAGLPVRRSDER